MKRSRQRLLAAFVAILFLVGMPPAQAEADDEMHPYCFACHECAPDLWCTGCGIYTMYAISGCCQLNPGTAFCMPEWGGFAVNCNDGSRACQCNMVGQDCYTIG